MMRMGYILRYKCSVSTTFVVYWLRTLMIRFRLKQLIADTAFRENRRITLNDVAEATRIHRVTLSKIANERGYNAGTDSIDRLCRYFRCQPGDIMEFVDEPEE